jgi:hypothetical protein
MGWIEEKSRRKGHRQLFIRIKIDKLRPLDQRVHSFQIKRHRDKAKHVTRKRDKRDSNHLELERGQSTGEMSMRSAWKGKTFPPGGQASSIIDWQRENADRLLLPQLTLESTQESERRKNKDETIKFLYNFYCLTFIETLIAISQKYSLQVSINDVLRFGYLCIVMCEGSWRGKIFIYHECSF